MYEGIFCIIWAISLKLQAIQDFCSSNTSQNSGRVMGLLATTQPSPKNCARKRFHILSKSVHIRH